MLGEVRAAGEVGVRRLRHRLARSGHARFTARTSASGSNGFGSVSKNSGFSLASFTPFSKPEIAITGVAWFRGIERSSWSTSKPLGDRKAEVENEDVGVEFLRHTEARHPVGGGPNDVALEPERRREQLTRTRIVFDDQHRP